MPVMLWWVAVALADRIYSATPLEGEAAVRVPATVPGGRMLPFAELTGASTLDRDRQALATLRQELDACRPLLDAFDGELEIMARLDKAIADIGALTSDADRLLVGEALVLQGYAVEKYFQAGLGTESAAAPYREGTGSEALVRAWIDATALPDLPAIDATRIPEAELRLAWDQVQARQRAMPSITVVVGELARGAEVWVDGRPIAATLGSRVIMPPGRHWIHVQVGEAVLHRESRRYEPGATVNVSAPFGPLERDALLGELAVAEPGAALPEAAARHLAGLGEPVYVVAPDRRGVRLLRVDRGIVEETRLVDPDRAEASEAWTARVALGAGWLSSGDFYLQNVTAGAPSTRATVNAVTPAFDLSGGWRSKWLAVDVGLDGQLTPGRWHALPSGEGEVRAFVYPHVAVGLPWVQVSGGFQTPWYPAAGLHAAAPLPGPLELVGRAVYGFPVELARGADPAFLPEPALSAWLGLGWRPLD